MEKRSSIAFGTVVLGLSLSSNAAADVAPPDGYVETCTVEQQQAGSIECLSCSAYFGEPDRCSTLLAPYCYVHYCKTWGASVWGEVWCRTKNSVEPTVPTAITAQLSTTDAPVVAAGGAGGAANCPETPLPAGGAASNNSSSGSKGGCSITRPESRAGAAWGSVCALLAGALVGARRRIHRRS